MFANTIHPIVIVMFLAMKYDISMLQTIAESDTSVKTIKYVLQGPITEDK